MPQPTHLGQQSVSACNGMQLTSLTSTSLAFSTANQYRFYVSCARPAAVTTVARCENNAAPQLSALSPCSPASAHAPARPGGSGQGTLGRARQPTPEVRRREENLARAAVSQLPYALTKLPTAAASPGSAFIISPSPSSGGNSFSPMLDFH